MGHIKKSRIGWSFTHVAPNVVLPTIRKISAVIPGNRSRMVAAPRKKYRGAYRKGFFSSLSL